MTDLQDHLAERTEAIVKSGQRIQDQIDRKDDARTSGKEGSKPMQAGRRDYPESFPNQHLKKPGLESELEVKPMFEAPSYKGSGKLDGMVALITGGDRELAAP